ncbi:hypothetical protein P154DRAFT_311047 [Amniculicola lignicola CBS 123094]|uniref:Secreted protein n=1 Tax=Amniculicola lignicola CBS 123094 TaxID=1392246 RepID=A0A6A5WBK9_9PLEO|nr:hypothetical protein P154DRAFT_311047 [Amniculicola lignicola CBS 123094]
MLVYATMRFWMIFAGMSNRWMLCLPTLSLRIVHGDGVAERLLSHTLLHSRPTHHREVRILRNILLNAQLELKTSMIDRAMCPICQVSTCTKHANRLERVGVHQPVDCEACRSFTCHCQIR